MIKRVARKKIISFLFVEILIVTLIMNAICFNPLILIGHADSGDISNSWDNSTTLNVTILEIPPRINWYDFQYNQSGTWVSKRNTQIDVNNSAEYRFIANISSDQGWNDIEYVNITAWYDQGDESSTYNETVGGNFNLMLQYKNTTGTADWSLMWPLGGEVTEGEYTETVSYDPYGSPGHTECYNLTFSFIPDYQFRYAPGDGSWDNTTNATDDTQSWNFMINAVDAGNNSDSITDEFGVYSYTEIMNVGWPSILGNPGVNATAQSNITILTRSNGNYSLSIDVGNLTHNTHPTANMSRDNIWLRGGDLDNSDNFTADSGVIYIYGGAGSYHLAQADGTSLTANDLEYTCDIPVGQMAGDYTATIDYHLITT